MLNKLHEAFLFTLPFQLCFIEFWVARLFQWIVDAVN